MKVKIFTEGGGEIGLGHIGRCCSLYDELNERGISAEFIIFGDINGLSILQDKNVSNTDWFSYDYLSSHIDPSDYCIVDSYLATGEIYQAISRQAKKALFIDDHMSMAYPKGIIVRPSLYKNKPVGKCKGPEHMLRKGREHIYLTGADFIPLRRAFAAGNGPDPKRSREEVLITMGGTDIRNLTPIIIEHLCRKYSDMKFHIVADKDKTELFREKRPDHVLCYHNIDGAHMKELMLKSRFAISAAGQTIYELLATGTPFMAIKVIDNQADNVRALKELLPELPVIAYEDRDFTKKLEAGFEAMLRQTLKEDFGKGYRKLVDGMGRKRIVDALLTLEL